MADGFLDNYLPYLFRRADQLLSAAFYEKLAEYDVTQSEWRVLAVLHERGPMSMSDLADTALSPQPTATHAVARLERRELVERSAGTEDRRQRFASATRAGHDLAAKLISEAVRLETGVLRRASTGALVVPVDELKHASDREELVTPRGVFPHIRIANGFAFVSGTSSRRPNDTFAGVEVDQAGNLSLDIAAQTTAVLENIERILGTVGLDRSHLVDVGVFLVHMADFDAFNDAWATFFTDTRAGIRATKRRFDDPVAPARTTVAVRELPHPNILVEMKATAALDETAR